MNERFRCDKGRKKGKRTGEVLFASEPGPKKGVSQNAKKKPNGEGITEPRSRGELFLWGGTLTINALGGGSSVLPKVSSHNLQKAGDTSGKGGRKIKPRIRDFIKNAQNRLNPGDIGRVMAFNSKKYCLGRETPAYVTVGGPSWKTPRKWCSLRKTIQKTIHVHEGKYD